MQDMNSLQELFAAASRARENAYAPYSGFKVGAAVRSESGKIYAGCNVENISYPCGTCAEAGAIAAMAAEGDRKIREIAIVTGGSCLITPCGACRQRIKEFGGPDTLIHLAGPQGIEKSVRLADLLPLAFDETELKK